MKQDAYPRIVVVTGEKESGKTTLCEWCASEFLSRRFDVAGLLSISEIKDGCKTAINARIIRTGESNILAQRSTDFDLSSITPRWNFDNKVLEWGNEQLNTCIPCDLLIIDELGWMEFNHQKGWTNAFSILNSREYQIALVVIRPQLLALAHDKIGEFSIVEVTPDTRIAKKRKLEEVISGNLEPRMRER